MEIEKIQKEIHRYAVEKGWWDVRDVNGNKSERSIGDQFANFHSEISEAWEEYRNGHAMNEIYEVDGKPEGIPIELADCIIRILDTAEAYKMDIARAIIMKMEYNSRRKFRHGGKRA